MPDFITLTCPSCGGKLQITNDIERFTCGYCGNEQIINRKGGVVTITPVVEGLKQVQRGTDKTAAELALIRLQEEYSTLSKQIHQLIYSTMDPSRYKSVLSKRSFWDRSLASDDGIRKRIENLSEGDIGILIEKLKNRNNARNRLRIEQLTTFKSLKSRLREVLSRYNLNKSIVDDIPIPIKSPITAGSSIPAAPKLMKSEDKRENLSSVDSVTTIPKPLSESNHPSNVLGYSSSQETPKIDDVPLSSYSPEADRIAQEEAARRKIELKPIRRRQWGWVFSIGGGLMVLMSICLFLTSLFPSTSAPSNTPPSVYLCVLLPLLLIGGGLLFLGIKWIRSKKEAKTDSTVAP